MLIAPSWQEDCILDSCANEVIGALVGHGYRVIVRPHPEYTKRYRARWEALQSHFSQYPDDELHFESDFSSSDSIFDSDVLITDWSSIFCEFSFATLKPCVFINTAMKVGNPNWKLLEMEPVDISLRNQVGHALDPADLDLLPGIVSEMLAHPEAWRKKIEDVRSKLIFNLGQGGSVAGSYLLECVLDKQNSRKEDDGESR